MNDPQSAAALKTLIDSENFSFSLKTLDERQGFPQLFDAVLKCDSPSWALALAEKLGLLDSMLPELARCRRLEQNPYHHLPVFEHTLLVVGHMEAIADAPERFLPLPDILADRIRREKRALILAALGHDFGKVDTRQQGGKGYFTFYRHERISAELFANMARRLEIATEHARLAETLIEDHMLFAPIAVRWARGDAGMGALRRLLRRFGTRWPLMAALALADVTATRGPAASPAAADAVRGLAGRLVELQREVEDALKRPKRAVTGTDIIETLGVPQGPMVGKLLKLADIMFERNPDLDRETLLNLLKKTLNP